MSGNRVEEWYWVTCGKAEGGVRLWKGKIMKCPRWKGAQYKTLHHLLARLELEMGESAVAVKMGETVRGLEIADGY